MAEGIEYKWLVLPDGTMLATRANGGGLVGRNVPACAECDFVDDLEEYFDSATYEWACPECAGTFLRMAFVPLTMNEGTRFDG